MRISTLTLTLILAAVTATTARAQGHADVVPYALNNKIVTGGHNDVSLEDTIELRVFGYDFGEDPFDPYFISDPGFNNGGFAIGLFPNDGLLPSGFTLGFDVVTNLQYWDGAGGVSFAAAPVDVALGLQRGSNTVYVSGSGQTDTVPTISSTGATGRVHAHLSSLLTSTDGVDPMLPNAPDGIYMLGLTLKLPGSGLANSDPIYIVYNNGFDEEIHDEAIDWVQTNLVPEPSSYLLMGTALSAISLIGWRKRRQSAVVN
jgi:hypothetical protein